MSDMFTDDGRRLARIGLRRTLQAVTFPVRVLARAAIRLRPGLEPRLARCTWLWQPGWSRGRHERHYRSLDRLDLAAAAEAAAHDLIMRTLAGVRPGRALDVGCGGGRLSERLVTIADELVGVDISEAAVARARARLAGSDRARFERRTLPFDMPEGTFDLIVCADVLHHWDTRTLRTGLDRLFGRLNPGGLLLLVHDLGDAGRACSGDTVHDFAIERCEATAGRTHLVGRTLADAGPRAAGVRLDVFVVPAPVEPDPAPEDEVPAIPAQRGSDQSRVIVASMSP